MRFVIFSPEAAQTTSFTVQAGDIILLGTDGLFDNMKEEIILQRISQMKVGISVISKWEVSNTSEPFKLLC